MGYTHTHASYMSTQWELRRLTLATGSSLAPLSLPLLIARTLPPLRLSTLTGSFLAKRGVLFFISPTWVLIYFFLRALFCKLDTVDSTSDFPESNYHRSCSQDSAPVGKMHTYLYPPAAYQSYQRECPTQTPTLPPSLNWFAVLF